MCLALAESRRRRLNRSATSIQSIVRMHLQRRLFLQAVQHVTIVQALARAAPARRYLAFLKREAAVCKIQRRFRGSQQVRAYRQILRQVLMVQLRLRLYLKRTRDERQRTWFLMSRSAVIVQRCVRGWLARR